LKKTSKEGKNASRSFNQKSAVVLREGKGRKKNKKPVRGGLCAIDI
tara:strand:- start:335 stop:472 length:138 start_codon:yes stop_codon:yes gene_type:complete